MFKFNTSNENERGDDELNLLKFLEPPLLLAFVVVAVVSI